MCKAGLPRNFLPHFWWTREPKLFYGQVVSFLHWTSSGILPRLCCAQRRRLGQYELFRLPRENVYQRLTTLCWRPVSMIVLCQPSRRSLLLKKKKTGMGPFLLLLPWGIQISNTFFNAYREFLKKVLSS